MLEVERRRIALAFAVFTLGVVSLVSACHPGEKNASELLAPVVATRVRYQLGSPLRGPDALTPALDASDLTAAQAYALDVTVIALAAPLDSLVPSVIKAARLVIHEGESGHALGASPISLASAYAGPVADSVELLKKALETDPPGRVLRETRAVLVPGATTVVELVRDAPTGDELEVRASLLLGRPRDLLELEPALEWRDGKSAPELVALESIPIGREHPTLWVAIVPSPFADGARNLLFLARASAAPDEHAPGSATHEEETALAARELAAQAAQAARIQRPAAPAPVIPDLGATRKALEVRESARRALFHLAVATGARTAEEVAVSVEDQPFAPIASGVAAAIGSAVAPNAGPREIGLVVEKAALAACRDLVATEDVPDDLNAALERRGGAAFYLLASFVSEIDKAKSLVELERLIETQNVALLEDAAPQIRVRAARWLEARGKDLCGFQALATVAERRAALQRIKARKPGGGS